MPTKLKRGPVLLSVALPAPASGEQAGYILERVPEYSRPFGTTVAVKGDTAEINLKSGN
jgi:hypothetical protein